MSHCWNQDGTLFSSVCSVVIGVSIFVAIVSVFCIFRITKMARKLKNHNYSLKTLPHAKVNSNHVVEYHPESIQHGEASCRVQIENGVTDGIDSIRTVETDYVTTNSITNHQQETSL